MSLCERCGSPATILLDFRESRQDLCDRCLDDIVDIPFFSELREAMIRRPRQTGTCPFCGTTVREVVDAGLAGCPLCYVSLGDVWARLGIVRLEQPLAACE